MASTEFYCSADEFLDSCLPFLLTEEDLYNGIISTAELIRDNSSIFTPPFLFAAAKSDDSTIGCALGTLPDGLLLSNVPQKFATKFIGAVLSQSVQYTRLSGDPGVVAVAARCYEELTRRRQHLKYAWNVYRLDKEPIFVDHKVGSLRLCNGDDLDLIVSWSDSYAEEVAAPIDVRQFLLRKLTEGLLYAWDINGPRAIASVSAPTPHGIRISAVYTPRQYRRTGYASTVVAELSRYLLRSGYRFVTLSAIQGDVSEAVYRRLGFYQIGQRHSYWDASDNQPSRGAVSIRGEN